MLARVNIVYSFPISGTKFFSVANMFAEFLGWEFWDFRICGGGNHLLAVFPTSPAKVGSLVWVNRLFMGINRPTASINTVFFNSFLAIKWFAELVTTLGEIEICVLQAKFKSLLWNYITQPSQLICWVFLGQEMSGKPILSCLKITCGVSNHPCVKS